MPIDVRSTSLALLAVIALIVFLNWAQAVLIPITFAVLLSYALTPVVDWLKRNVKLHKAIGAAMTLALIFGGLGFGLSSLQPEALNILDLVPRAMQKFTLALRSNPRAPAGAVAKIQKAASEIEKAANSDQFNTAMINAGLEPSHFNAAGFATPVVTSGGIYGSLHESGSRFTPSMYLLPLAAAVVACGSASAIAGSVASLPSAVRNSTSSPSRCCVEMSTRSISTGF